jgi:hypothetical protein
MNPIKTPLKLVTNTMQKWPHKDIFESYSDGECDPEGYTTVTLGFKGKPKCETFNKPCQDPQVCPKLQSCTRLLTMQSTN